MGQGRRTAREGEAAAAGIPVVRVAEERAQLLHVHVEASLFEAQIKYPQNAASASSAPSRTGAFHPGRSILASVYEAKHKRHTMHTQRKPRYSWAQSSGWHE